MAVYTKLTDTDCQGFLKHYALGELQALSGISAGVTNTNYRVCTTSGQYVLTLFEHIDIAKLPFYLDLVTHLAQSGIPCAPPIADCNDNTVHILHGKPVVIQPWLPGKAVIDSSVTQCREIGELLWQLHRGARDFSQRRLNTRGQNWRETMASQCQAYIDDTQRQHLQQAIKICARLPWQRLPQGVIHADLFPDNVLFDHDSVSGVFDFYYACYDALLLDIATTMNAWALDEATGKLNMKKAQTLLARYQDNTAFSAIEQQLWPDVLVAAALRFWLSRLYDQHHTPDPDGINQPKDPQPYYQLLQFYLEQPGEIKI